ncbi:MAG: adenylate/guanylate cyclase domain-containing protein [Chloroflexota bacterium]
MRASRQSIARCSERGRPSRSACPDLAAWDLDRDDWRTFRVDRIRPGMSPGDRFTPRELTDAAVEELIARGVPVDARRHQARVVVHAPAAELAERFGPWLGTISAIAPTLSMIPVGGFLASGGVGLWGILAPLGALVFADARSGVRWFVAFLVVFLGSGIAAEAMGSGDALPAWFLSTMLALNVVVGGTIVFTLLALFAKQRQNALIALRSEQDRAESLLLNILPRSIAEKLKAEPQTIADQFTAASVLFADVVDFTPHSEHLSPAEVVGVLDHLFSHFDALAERYGLEKIKTIGDCYMVAAGVPSPRPDHARALALMALDMVDAMRSGHAMGDLGLDLRIGINSGPVVAGVIGRKRFLYDLWGDAVNTASRMESHGTPGRIQITRATYELLEDEFECEPRGTVTIKGKGEMETWNLTGRRRAAAGSTPVAATA